MNEEQLVPANRLEQAQAKLVRGWPVSGAAEKQAHIRAVNRAAIVS